jgi:hypothetical protein
MDTLLAIGELMTKTGWNNATLLELCLEYIDNHYLARDFIRWLEVTAAYELDASTPLEEEEE